MCAQLHFNICKEVGVKLDKKHWYEHVPKSVETSQGGKVTILWNQQVQTDRTIPNNKADVIIRDNEKGTRMLIDVAISGDRNMIKKEAEKMHVITYSPNFAPPHFAARGIPKNTPHDTMEGHTASFFFSTHKAHTFARPDTFCKVWKSLGNAVPMVKLLFLPVRLRDVNVPIS